MLSKNYLLVALATSLLLVASSAQTLCGDCNRDGSVNIVDALTGAQHAVGLQTLTGQAFTNCDVDLNASVTVVDSLFIAQYATALPVTLCSGGMPVSGTCGMPVVLTSGVSVMGTTVGAPDMWYGSCQGLFDFNGEQVHSISFTGTRTINVTLTANYAAAVFVRSNCTSTLDLGCDRTAPYSLSIPSQPGGTYYIIVDGYGSPAIEGNYTLTVTAL